MKQIERYPNLFKPIRLGNVYFRNRIFSAPTGNIDLESGYTPSFDYHAYFERKAKGGAASVSMGEYMVTDYDPGTSRYNLILMKDRVHNYNGLAKLTDAISRNGAVATAELEHMGAASPKNGPFQLGVSDGRNPLNPQIMVREMNEEQIQNVINEYVEAAAYAQNRGFGMVLLHAGHGWLLNQFFSPFFNKRTDKWGGSAENRARLTVTIIDKIHERCGKGFPVEVRISGSELFEGGYGIEGGIEFAKQLDGHADLIHVSAGNPYVPSSSIYTHPNIFMEGGCNVWLAAEIKKHVSTPVATIGGLSDPDELEEIIASGKADVVEMARGLICDPDLPRKLREGREKEVRKCLRCFNCIREKYVHARFFCSINPESAKEREILSHHTAKKKHVLVAGGGMAGMQAAITAAENGHKVTLCEKSDKLGGVLLCEVNVPFKRRIGDFIERQKYMIDKLGVEVRLNTAVTSELVGEINPDALIVAIGGVPMRPDITGIDGENVIGVEEAFAKPELAKGKVVVVGAGRSGSELGIYLKESFGSDVVLIEAAPQGDQAKYIAKMAEVGLETMLNTRAKEIKAGGIVCDTPEGEQFIEADTVVLALGVKPLWDEVEALSSFAGEFHQVGDCRTPRGILEANGEGWTAANLVGRI